MDRRTFLTTGGVAAAAVAVGTTPAAASPEPAAAAMPSPAVHGAVQTFRLALPWADAVAGPADEAHRIASQLASLSGHRWRFEIASNDSDLSGAEFALATEEIHQPGTPALAYVSGLPGEAALAPAVLEAWFAMGGGQEHWDGMAAAVGRKALLAGHLGPSPLLHARRAVTALADLEGLKVAAAGTAAEMLAALGAETVAVPAARLTEALRSGEIDGAFGPGTMTAMMLGIPQAAPFATDVGIQPSGTILSLRIALDVWDGLADGERDLIRLAAADAHRRALVEAAGHETIIRRALATRQGVSFGARPADLAAAVPRLADAIIAHIAASGPEARRMDASYMAFRRAVGVAPASPHPQDIPSV